MITPGLDTANMDLVYIVKAPVSDEFLYSLRSVAENLPHLGLVVVSRELPRFIDPGKVTFIFSDAERTNDKYGAAGAGLTLAAKHKAVSDWFILMNDDFFIKKRIDKMPYYYDRRLSEVHKRCNSRFQKAMNRLGEFLTLKGATEYNFDVHFPIPLCKKWFSSRQGDIEDFRNTCAANAIFPIRSHLVNLFGDPNQFIQRKDCKVRSQGEAVDDPMFLSTFDKFTERNRLYIEVKRQFTQPSRYELVGTIG
jgi:hypothetical protein